MMKDLKKKFCKYEEMILLFMGIAAANLIAFNQENWTMNPLRIAILSVICYAALVKVKQNREMLKDIRVLTGGIIFGILFTGMMVVGQKIHAGDGEFKAFEVSDIVWLFFYLGLGVLLFFSLYLLCREKRLGERILKGKRKFSKKRFLIYAGILAVCWVPVWVIYFPGIVPEDATVSIAMVVGELPWDNHFPVFYSLIVGACMFVGACLGNLNIGIALYSMLQLVTMALLLGYFLEWLHAKGIWKTGIYLAIAFFVAAPVFGNYAIVMWKDPWFSGALLLLGLFLYDHVAVNRESFLEKRNLLYYGGLVILVSLLRNNGIYVVLLISICLLSLYRKQIKKVLITSAVSILLVYVITGPVYQYVFSAENLFVESVGIPLQQMARVVVTGGSMTDVEKEFLNQLLPIEKYGEYYNPFLVDPLKWAPEFDTEFLDSHKEEFFKTWFSMLKSNFGTYVEQYLMGTFGFWHIGGDTHYEFVKTYVAENTWGLYQYMPVEQYAGYGIQEALDGKYDFTASGLLIWILLFDAIFCWVRKKSVYLIPLLVMIGNWVTLMIATPTAFGLRYIYIFMIGLPLLLTYPWLLDFANNTRYDKIEKQKEAD